MRGNAARARAISLFLVLSQVAVASQLAETGAQSTAVKSPSTTKSSVATPSSTKTSKATLSETKTTTPTHSSTKTGTPTYSQTKTSSATHSQTKTSSATATSTPSSFPTPVWQQYGYNSAHSGRSKYSGPTDGAVLWTVQSDAIADTVYSSPALAANGDLFVGWGNVMVRLDASNAGATVWSFACPTINSNVGNVRASPAQSINGAVVYFGSENWNLYSVDASTGTQNWAFTADAKIDASLVVGPGGLLYIGAASGTLYSLEDYGSSFELRWHTSVCTSPLGTAARGLELVFVGCDDAAGTLTAVTVANGAIVWSVPTGGGLQSAPSFFTKSGNSYIFIGALDGHLYGFNASDGSDYFTAPFATDKAIVATAAVGLDGTIYVGSYDYNFYAISCGVSTSAGTCTPTLAWKFSTALEIDAAAAIGKDGTVYFGSSDNNFYALDSLTGNLLWSAATGGEFYSSPAIGADGNVYVGNSDGNVYCFNQVSPTSSGTSTSTPSSSATGTPSSSNTGSASSSNTGSASSSNTGTASSSNTGSASSSNTGSASSSATGTSSSSATGTSSASATPTPYPTPVWQQYGYDYRHAGVSRFSAPSNGAVAWSVQTDATFDNVYSSPAIGADGSLFVGWGTVMAKLDATNVGATLWSFNCPTINFNVGNVYASPALAGSGAVVYFGSENWYFYALNAATGATNWEFAADSQIDASPVVSPGGTIFFGAASGTMYALADEGATYKLLWSVSVCGAPLTTATVTLSLVIVGCNDNDGTLTALNITDGATVWSVTTGGGLQGAPAISGAYVFVGALDGGLHGFAAADGSAYFDAPFATGNAIVATPSIGSDGTIYVGSKDNNFYAVTCAPAAAADATAATTCTPTQKWSFTTGYEIDTAAAIGSDGTVYFGSFDQYFYALNGQTGAVLWSAAVGGEFYSSPAIGADDKVYVGNGDGHVYCFGQVSSTPTPTPTGTATSTPAPSTPPQWGQFGYDRGHSGRSPYAGPTNGQAVCARQSDANFDNVYASPAIDGDGAVFVGWGTVVAKLDAASLAGGPSVWEFNCPTINFNTGDVYSSPAIAGGGTGTVYVGSDNYYLYALDAATGAKKWEFATDGAIDSGPVIGSDGGIYFGDNSGTLFALTDNDDTYTLRWSYAVSPGNILGSSPSIGADGTVYIGVGDSVGTVTAITSAGALKWAVPTGIQVDSTPAVSEALATVYVGAYDGNLYSLSMADGSVIWKFPTGGEITSSPVIGSDGTIYFGSYDNNFYAVVHGSKLVPELKWSYTTGYYIVTAAAIGSDGTVYVGSFDQSFYAFDGQTGAVLWSAAVGGEFYSAPAIGANGLVYAGNGDGHVYCFGPVSTTPTPTSTSSATSTITGTNVATSSATSSATSTSTPSPTSTVTSTPTTASAAGSTFTCYGDAHATLGVPPLSLTASRAEQCGACWADAPVDVTDFAADFTLALDEVFRCGGSRVALKLHGELYGTAPAATADAGVLPGAGRPNALSCSGDRERRYAHDTWALYFEAKDGGLEVELTDGDHDDEHDRHFLGPLARKAAAAAAAATLVTDNGVIVVAGSGDGHHPIGPGTWNIHVTYKQTDGRLRVQWARVGSNTKPRSKWFTTDLAHALGCDSDKHWPLGGAHPHKPSHPTCVVGLGFVGSTGDWCYERQTVTAFAFAGQ